MRGSIAIITAVACGACAWPGRSPVERAEPLTFDGVPPVHLSLHVPASHARHIERYVSTAERTLRMLVGWFGPYPHAALRVSERGWTSRTERHASDQRAAPGEVMLRTSWLSSARGGMLEANLAYGIAREFWPPAARPSDTPLLDGLALYAAARLLHEVSAGEHAYEVRYLGDRVPYVLRSVPLAGPDGRLTQLGGAPEAQRAARAMFTLERYLGWATLQEALWAFTQGLGTGSTERPIDRRDHVEDLRVALELAAGRDLSWFLDAAFRSMAVFDYGIDQFTSEASADDRFRYATTLVVRRYGDASFAGTSQPHAGVSRSRGPIEVLVTFEDGSEMDESWDGRDEAVTFQYASVSPARTAIVDPHHVLWLDQNRANNYRTLDERRGAAAVWAVRWAVWLQDALLTSAALF
jgi:hypothetical protein